jgi:hypothetical protein
MAPALDEREIQLRRRRRSIALAIVLGAVVVLFYLLTIFKMGPQIFNRPL